eukprot:4079615-Amphidinium_carterae.4
MLFATSIGFAARQKKTFDIGTVRIWERKLHTKFGLVGAILLSPPTLRARLPPCGLAQLAREQAIRLLAPHRQKNPPNNHRLIMSLTLEWTGPKYLHRFWTFHCHHNLGVRIVQEHSRQEFFSCERLKRNQIKHP